MAGRRPKPTRLKVVAGNPGKRKINDKEPAPAHEIPSPPSHLTDWGKVAWGKLTVLLDGMGVMTIADGLALERLCDIYADILQLRDTIAVEGRRRRLPAAGCAADADHHGGHA
ncbi:P27 family phage terminase small subunit [Salmonella enterica subsp. diarizonae]|nr:P27 family phage terminase small subunit [Salmonella enterica subsp. diarizonae]